MQSSKGLSTAQVVAVSAAAVAVFAVLSVAVSMASAQTTAFLTLDNYSGPPGSTVNVSGTDYGASEMISVYLGSTMNAPTATTTSRADGTFGPVSVIIPPDSVQGNLIITAVGASSTLSASNKFYVNALAPSIAIATTTNNQPGESIQISLGGFVPDESVAVSMSTSTATTTVDGGGNGSMSFTIPFVSDGTYKVTAIGQSSHAEANTYFYVAGFYPYATASDYYLLPGETQSFSGTGFASNETICVINGTSTASLAECTNSTSTASSSILSSFKADGSGAFSDAGTFTIPWEFANTTPTLTIIGASSGASDQITFTVGAYYPALTPSTYFANIGDYFTVTGTGFAPNEKVNANVFGDPAFSSFSDASGTVGLGPFIVPSNAPSMLQISAIGSTSDAAATTSITIGDATNTVSAVDILPLSLGNGTVGTPYSTTLTASTTASGTLTWSVASGTLPFDFTISPATGASTTISGTPTSTGTFDFSISVSNGNGSSATNNYSLLIASSTASSTTSTSTTSGNTSGSSGSGNTVNTGGGGGGGGPIIFVPAPSGPPLTSNASSNTTSPFTPLAPNTGVQDTSGSNGAGGNSGTGSTITFAQIESELISIESKFITIQFELGSCPADLNRNLSLGSAGPDVAQLQRDLNISGLTEVASTGPGSPGNETQYFGGLTKNAVTTFQNIFAPDVLTPAGLTEGTGYVGTYTRAKLNSLCSNSGGASSSGTSNGT